MKPTPAVVDVPLSTLDQAGPVTDKPIGRLSALINAQVKLYQNPRFNVQDGSVAHVKVEKRDAFVTLGNTYTDEAGNSVAAPVGEPQVLFGGGDVMRQVIANRLYSRSGTGWVKASNPIDGDAVVFPQIVRSRSIYAADTQIQGATLATIGDVSCSVWREISMAASDNSSSPTLSPTSLNGIRISFRNVAEQSTLVPPFTFDPAGGSPSYQRTMVLAQNGQFWVLQDYDNGSNWTIWISIFSVNGVFVDKTSVVVGTSGSVSGADRWDASVILGQGLVIATPSNSGTGVHFDCYTYSSGFTHTSNTDATIRCAGRQVAWIRDDSPVSNLGYLVSVDVAVGILLFTAHQITSMASVHTYSSVSPLASVSPSTTAVSGIAGYKVPSTTDVVIAYSTMDLVGVLDGTNYTSGSDGSNTSASDDYPNQLNNLTTTHHVPFSGSPTLILTRQSIAIASRAFAIGSDYAVIGYYPACQLGPLDTPDAAADHYPQRPVNPSNFQPTYYVLPLNSQQQIAGRLEYGLAARDEQVVKVITPGGGVFATQPCNRCLADVVTTQTGALMTVLGYRVEVGIPDPGSFTNVNTVSGFGIITNNQVYQTSDTVGVKLFTFGPDCGRPFIVGQTTYFPGLMSQVVEPGDTAIAEHGIIAPECPRVLKSTTASTIPSALIGEYFYRGVAESTTRSGREYRSLPSAAFAFTLKIGDNVGLAVTSSTCSLTNRKSVKISLYRSAVISAQVISSLVPTTPAITTPTSGAGAPTFISNAATTGLFKITDDLTPFYGIPGAPTNTFTDLLSSGTQGTGEELYVDSSLPRYPAPAFRGGCVWLNRAWVIGYDNALWFSGELADGEGEYFNPGLRVVVPTNEEITAIAPMDSFLLIFCANSVWYLPETSALPDNTGTGSIPTAIRLPFEMGGTGFTGVIRQGCMYSSSQGGVWMITRSLDNVWIGQNAKDDLAPLITGMCIAGNTVIATNGTYVMAYDTNLGAWGRWNFPVPATAIGAFGGLALFSNTGPVWQQTPGSFIDHDTINSVTYYAPTTATISPVHVGGIRSWKRTWEIQAQGQVVDFCDVIFTLAYGDYNTNIKTYKNASLTPGPLAEAIRPTLQLASSVGMTVTDAANASTTTGAGFSLEVMSLYVGLEKGPNKLPPGARAKS